MADKENTKKAAAGNGQMSEEELFSEVEYKAEEAERTGYSDYSYWGSVFKNFLRKKSAVVMSVIFVAVVVFSFVALKIAKYDYRNLIADTTSRFVRPNSQYWFGTDNIGRDYWCQVWYSAQISIKLALLVGLGETVLGVAIGCLWGYVRSLDFFFTRLYNILTNVPEIIYMTLIALFIGQSFTVMCVALIAFGWMGMARETRNLVILYRDREYNLASRCLGSGIGKILTKNIVPYLMSIILLRFALNIPRTIATETTLSYLGLGLDINTPSLGILLRNARSYFMDYPYLLIFPAVIVSVISITFYLVGNAFADACDPKNHV
ncbi:MAG: ABC transporter permease [Lachnospiraceae bacterium]|nr:ABC transporter permease [Lachnospiraceae bacterium]